jgi:hypothetical protein
VEPGWRERTNKRARIKARKVIKELIKAARSTPDRVVEETLKDKKVIGSVTLLAIHDPRTYEMLLFELRRVGVKTRDVQALQRVVSAEVKRQKAAPRGTGDNLLAHSGSPEQDAQSPYQCTDQGLILLKPTREGGLTPVRFTNFHVQIVEEVIKDDGVEMQRYFLMEARIGDETIRFLLPADQLQDMKWVAKYLGACAIVYAGQGIKDHARVAIQSVSVDRYPPRGVYPLWVEEKGRTAYLSPRERRYR